ncbi:tetratricopeptide repeat protein [Corynebacterium timonense]|uniref:Putative thioredoxin n=1 Tax=Corynebacterium timonense TaxID=441500 RepID=A0A1H1Q3J1_9CORY|nr:tetratricopeptide repeat protein [Corynebacterium timonense]SDS17934.1 putative thioredoxin [Corynebacterium timonense]
MADFEAGAVDLPGLAQQGSGAHAGFQAFIEATQDNLEEEVLKRSVQVPVIVVVGSARSPQSDELKATFRELADGQRAFRVAYVDADAHPMLAQMLGVRSVPTTLALAAGRPVTSFEGGQPRAQLEQWVAALVAQIGPQLEGLGDEEPGQEQPHEDPRLDAATEALNRGDFDAAIEVYDALLAEEPNNPEIAQAKATVGVLKRLDPDNRETDPIAEAEAAPGDVDKQLAAADAEVVAGAPEKAFARLTELVTAEPRAKERLLELFTLFDASDPRVITARTNLASALF